MDIARRESELNPIGTPAELAVARAISRDPWGNWSRILHAGLILLGALASVSPSWAGSSMARPDRANALLAGGWLLAVEVAALRLAAAPDRRLCFQVLPPKWTHRIRTSKGELLMILDSLACLLGAWLVLSPIVFSLRWPSPGLPSMLLGLSIFLFAEAGQLAELNHQVPVR